MNEPFDPIDQPVVTEVPPPPPPPARRVSPVSPTAPVMATRTAPYGYRGRQVVWLAVAVVDAFLVVRFVFLAVRAGASEFTSFIYTVGGALAEPFRGIFATTVRNGHPLEWAALLAIAVYTFAAWVVTRLITIASRSNNRGLTAY